MPVELTVQTGEVADINVAPLAINKSLPAGVIGQETLTIKNDGGVYLFWQLSLKDGADCTASGSPSWLTAVPVSGTTDAGNTTAVALGFDSTALSASAYQSTICIHSSDPGHGNRIELVPVPVELTFEKERAYLPIIH